MEKGMIIKRLREQKGLSQVELAEKIGVSKQTLYKYEKGIVTNIPSDKIEALAKALGTTPEVLMGWAPPPKTGFEFIMPASMLEDDKSFSAEIIKKQELARLSESINANFSGVQTNAHPVYYNDPVTAKMAQKVFEDENFRILFDAATDSAPENIKLAAEMLRRLKENNK